MLAKRTVSDGLKLGCLQAQSDALMLVVYPCSHNFVSKSSTRQIVSDAARDPSVI
jgi:hypothetical protein